MRKIVAVLIIFFINLNFSFASGEIYLNNNPVNFNTVVGLKIYNNMSPSFFITPDNQTFFYSNETDGNKIYKKGINEVGDGTPFTISQAYYGKISPDGQNIFYSNGNAGMVLYKKGINDSGDGVAISNVGISTIDITPDSQYVIFQNSGDMSLYKKGINDENEAVQFTSVYSMEVTISPDSQTVYYMNMNDGGKVYKKGIDEVGDGVAFINNSTSTKIAISPDGQTIYYINSNDGSKIYRKGINDIDDGVVFINNPASSVFISPDNQIIFYNHQNDGNKLYKKGINDSGDGVVFIDIPVFYPIVTSDGNIIYGGDWAKIYKININNPVGYLMNDNTYRSSEILNTINNIYIKTDTTLLSETNFEFWLANQSTEQIIINEGGQNNLNGTVLDNSSGLDMSSLGLNVGDEIVVYKGGNEAITIITQIQPWRITFNNVILSNGIGYGIKKGSTNFLKLNNTVLDGNTEVNTQTVFGSTTNKLFYQIVLIGDNADTTKTPVINSVSITATPQTSGGVQNNNTNTSSTGGIDLNLGDGSSISIPVEKQTTDFIKTIATKPSINPASLNTYDKVETFLKDNNYDYTNQLLIGSGSIPSLTMYNVINLGLTNSALSDTLSGAINSSSYAKLVLGEDTYLAGKRIISYLKMDKADDYGHLVISIYKSDTKEYIFLRKKD